jgi:general secretion pathway protein C
MRAMVISSTSLWPPRVGAFVLAAAAAASAVYWTLQVQSVQVQAPLVSVESVTPAAVDSAAVARALGANPQVAGPVVADVSVSSRMVLAGIVAANKGSGAALIVVDGKPAKPFQVGAKVVDNWVLSRVQPRTVSLSQGGAEVVLELPLRAALPLQK